MSVLMMIIFGLIVGAVAKLLMPGKDPGGFIVTILLGIAGSLLGGFIFSSMGVGQGTQYAGFLGSVVGALLLLVLYRLFVGRRRPT
jgi:uncharacterized membrane protein YeaQ/YmgE (transglycosylase-associated protein family)